MSVAREPFKDPVKVAPNIYSVVLENDVVRLLDIRMKAGEKSPMHSHPAGVIVPLTSGKARFTFPDGTAKEMGLQAGQAVWIEAETHAAENVGTTELHVLQLELKERR